jgi:hypothetical protein
VVSCRKWVGRGVSRSGKEDGRVALPALCLRRPTQSGCFSMKSPLTG